MTLSIIVLLISLGTLSLVIFIFLKLRDKELEEKGKKIINLGIGQPDLKPPKYVIEEAINSLKKILDIEKSKC